VRDIRGTRGRVIRLVLLVALVAALWVPAYVAGRYADGPGGAEVGIARIDRGWEFLYHAVWESRGAVFRTDDAALVRARNIWAGPPAVAGDVQLVYMDGDFAVPVPPGGTPPAPADRTARPLSRLGWVVWGSVRGGPRQVIGVIDYHSGRVAWNLLPLPAPAAA
jgi:hypothetical protein